WLRCHSARVATSEVFIQLGAILAVVWLYRTKIMSVLREAPSSAQARGLIINLFIAFLPAAIVGLLLHDWIKARLFTPLVVAASLVVGGVVILLIERRVPQPAPATQATDATPRSSEVDNIPPRTALGVGLAQVLSLVPGVSRSGATIMGGLVLGL